MRAAATPGAGADGDTIADVAVFVVGFIAGASVVAAVSIVFPPRRVRQERVLDDEVETRILLGLDPEPEDAGAPMPQPHDYDSSDLAALRALDADRRSGRRRT